MSRFTVHGRLELDVQDRILLIEGQGPWNLEAVKEAYSRFKSSVESLQGGPWAALVEMHGDAIYVPEAASYIVRIIKNQRKQGLVASAILVEGSHSVEFVKRHLSELHTQAGDTFRFFSNKQDAEWWLQQHIQAATLASL